MLDKKTDPKDKPGIFIPPFAAPLTGNESTVKATLMFMRNPLEGFGPLSYNQPIVSVKTFRTTIHTITDPGGMNEVLKSRVKDFRKSPLNDRIMKPATKEGLLVVHGEQWRRQRHGVAPMFAPRHMADLAPKITEALDEFEKTIEAGDGTIELRSAMSDLTFDVLAKSVLGDPQGMDKEHLKDAMQVAVDVAGTIRPSDLLALPSWMPRPIGPRGLRALKTIRAAADDLLASRDPNNPGDDLVGLLVSTRDSKTGQGLSAREQRDNLIGFFIAGHETTALTLTWALYLIGNHPDVEARIVKEVLAVAGQGTGKGAVTYEHMAKLPFTRAVIDETMRLYPPAPLMGREAVNDTEISGRKIAKGDIILLATYVMHRTERLWENPNLFQPDRFIENPDLNRGKGKFMPFGAGPRVCVGAAFAVMEAVMALATLVRDYEITPDPECRPKLKMKITLRPDRGIPATVRRREV